MEKGFNSLTFLQLHLDISSYFHLDVLDELTTALIVAKNLQVCIEALYVLDKQMLSLPVGLPGCSGYQISGVSIFISLKRALVT